MQPGRAVELVETLSPVILSYWRNRKPLVILRILARDRDGVRWYILAHNSTKGCFCDGEFRAL
jgi:hypothetical protein